MKNQFVQNAGKEIVYWGIGKICKFCLEQHSDIHPVFFIDSNSKKRIYSGKPVRSPEEMTDWSLYYIIITIKSDEAIENIREILKQKGLKEGKDFCSYKDAFQCSNPSIGDSINLIGTFMEKHIEVVSPTMLVLPLEVVRNSKSFMSFISNYVQARTPFKCLLFSHLRVLSEQEAFDRLQCPVFSLPDFLGEEQGCLSKKLSEEECCWIRELEKRKISSNIEKSIKVSEGIFSYYEDVLEIVRPSKLIYWGNWSKESYILGYLANKKGIPCGYMEHGWLPGTYQVDPRGIMGQSEYAVDPFLFKNTEIDVVYDIEKIKAFIREQKLDTRIFMETNEDNAALKKIDKGKKIVFLVGMDDYGMQMNPDSDYWKTYISNTVKSTEQALYMLIDICRSNNWNLIFKPHPGNPIPQFDNSDNFVTLVRETEIDRLIKLADVVVSIASAVDYKTLVYGKPLVQLGINGLMGKGCSYIVSENASLEDSIKVALEEGMTCRQKENFNHLLQILLQKYLWDDMSERELRYGLGVERDFING